MRERGRERAKTERGSLSLALALSISTLVRVDELAHEMALGWGAPAMDEPRLE